MLLSLRKHPEGVVLSIMSKLTPAAYTRFRQTSRFCDDFAEANRDLLNITVYNTSLVFVDDILLLNDICLMVPKPNESNGSEILIGTGIKNGNTYRIKYRAPMTSEMAQKTIKAISGFRFETIEAHNLGTKQTFNRKFSQWKNVIRRSKCNVVDVIGISAHQLEKMAKILKPRTLSVKWNLGNGSFPDCVKKWRNVDVHLYDSKRKKKWFKKKLNGSDVRNFFENRETCKVSWDEVECPVGAEQEVLNFIKGWQLGQSDLTYLKVKHRLPSGYLKKMDLLLNGSQALIPFWNGYKVNIGQDFKTNDDMDPRGTTFPCEIRTPIEIHSWLVPSISSRGAQRWGLLCIKRVPNEAEGDWHSVVLTSLASPACPLDLEILALQLPLFFINCPPIDLSILRAQLNFCTVEEMGTQFSLFYNNCHMQQSFLTSASTCPAMIAKTNGTIQMLELPKRIILKIVQKMSARSFVNLRRCCSQMDIFAESSRNHIRISPTDRTQLSLFSMNDINPDMEQEDEWVEILLFSCRNRDDYSLRQTINKAMVPLIKEEISGFSFHTIVLKQDDYNKFGDSPTFSEAYNHFLEVIGSLRCAQLFTWDLNIQQNSQLIRMLQPRAMSMAIEHNLINLHKIPELDNCNEIYISFKYEDDILEKEPDFTFEMRLFVENRKYSQLLIDNIYLSNLCKGQLPGLLKSWQKGDFPILKHFRLKYFDDSDVYDSLDSWRITDVLHDLVPLFDGKRVNLGPQYCNKEKFQPYNSVYLPGEDTSFKIRSWLVPRISSSGKMEWAWLSVKALQLEDNCRITIILYSQSTTEGLKSPLDTVLLANCLPYLTLDYPPMTFDVLKERLDSCEPQDMGAVFSGYLEEVRKMYTPRPDTLPQSPVIRIVSRRQIRPAQPVQQIQPQPQLNPQLQPQPLPQPVPQAQPLVPASTSRLRNPLTWLVIFNLVIPLNAWLTVSVCVCVCVSVRSA